MRVGYLKNRLKRMKSDRKIAISIIYKDIHHGIYAEPEIKIIESCSLAIIEAVYKKEGDHIRVSDILKLIENIKDSYVIGLNVRNFYSGGLYIDAFENMKILGNQLYIEIKDE